MNTPASRRGSRRVRWAGVSLLLVVLVLLFGWWWWRSNRLVLVPEPVGPDGGPADIFVYQIVQQGPAQLFWRTFGLSKDDIQPFDMQSAKCSAFSLGNGVVITAAHCVGAGHQPTIQVMDRSLECQCLNGRECDDAEKDLDVALCSDLGQPPLRGGGSLHSIQNNQMKISWRGKVCEYAGCDSGTDPSPPNEVEKRVWDGIAGRHAKKEPLLTAQVTPTAQPWCPGDSGGPIWVTGDSRILGVQKGFCGLNDQGNRDSSINTFAPFRDDGRRWMCAWASCQKVQLPGDLCSSPLEPPADYECDD